MTCLAFLAGCTEIIQLGMSVMALPYRHPLHWSRIATTIDQLSGGRLILAVGVGWMEEEFAAMNAPFKERGQVSDEQLTLVKQLWSEEHITFHGKYYQAKRHCGCLRLSPTRNPGCRSGSAAKANSPSAGPADSATPGFLIFVK